MMAAGAPIIDVSSLVAGPHIAAGDDVADVATAIDAACRGAGFFSIVGHGVDPGLIEELEQLAREFFALDDSTKATIAMTRGGRAWRGWFPLGGELTSGLPDRKEGLYFGAELAPEHPKVRSGTPLHGPNQFPPEPTALRGAVLAYMEAMTALGHALVAGLALGLGLTASWFAEHLTTDPTSLFRIFRYPPGDNGNWGVAEHTDYGLLTILHQDSAGGLQVHAPGGWADVEPVRGALVCNLGDMLERMTSGTYRSTPHRVRNTSGADRVSLAFFFDPAWDAAIRPVPVERPEQRVDRGPRWDGADPEAFVGTYGDYLLAKVSRVFPELGDDLPSKDPRG
ncbi:MAG: isopenicillin N synthase family dioxygenase [Acidimicrobiales bacterium]